MKKYSLALALILFQCTSPGQKENETVQDTTSLNKPVASTSSESSEEVSNEDAGLYDADPTSLDLDEFTKHPFPSDYPYIKTFLREEGIAFNILAEDTIHSEHRIIDSDSISIDFLDSDPRFQDELGDLICSSDIRASNFMFNQDVVIGAAQEIFLTRANLSESSLTKDEDTNLSYYEHKVSWGEDEGYWKVTFWFNAGVLVRIQSEISPCYYDYGD
ncbi:MAG TPA: hypothetical protein PK325_03370 [Cyclobacteriaceae bacterium]|nr:hypothetical protein [Cyclobacteriaceae bacterium]HMV09882.1 hypothetical protein [Cyclobacteriaceae bacterium]HMV88708.1 hypothetical protein [Cyclobacteriaceae bacterium]HMW99620.1 hypothetical protein [Cyclobacteriaceae bacterium]HMX51003.1 hypothetical protein [Cyclobacteriaceae bacterium]